MNKSYLNCVDSLFLQRKKNLLRKNVNILKTPNNTNNLDTLTVNLIFQNLNVDIKSVTVHRLEKSNGKTRPLKATLNTATEVFKILGSFHHTKFSQIFNEVRITSDKIPKQREYF